MVRYRGHNSQFMPVASSHLVCQNTFLLSPCFRLASRRAEGVGLRSYAENVFLVKIISKMRVFETQFSTALGFVCQ